MLLSRNLKNSVFKSLFLKSNSLKTISSTNKINSNTTDSKLENEWIPIYHLPIIRSVAAFNKLKLYQFGLTLIGSPLLYYAEIMEQIPKEIALTFTSLGVTGSLTLIIASAFAKNLVGFIYYKQNDDNQLRVAYVDFWGNRKNLDLCIDDITSNNFSKTKSRFYQLIKTKESPFTLKLLQKFGRISDVHRFTYIFGE